MTITSLILLALVIILLVAFSINFGRLASLKIAHQNALSQIIDLQANIQDLGKTLKKSEEKIEKKQLEFAQHEKRFEIEKRSSSDQISKLEKSEASMRDELNILRNRKDHYEAQIAALTAQIKETDLQCKELRQKLGSHSQEQNKEVEKERLHWLQERDLLKERLSTLNKEMSGLRSDLDRQKSITEKVNLAEFASYRRKFKHFSRLYSTMRGLKEMVEERNQNWETALRALSIWVCQTNGKKISSDKIGVLVGEALESIGQTLLIEDETLPNETQIEAKISDNDQRQSAEHPAL